jgi:hypothetical protein
LLHCVLDEPAKPFEVELGRGTERAEGPLSLEHVGRGAHQAGHDRRTSPTLAGDLHDPVEQRGGGRAVLEVELVTLFARSSR